MLQPKLKLLKPFLLVPVLVLLLSAATAFAQNGNAYGGLINNHVQQQIYWQQHAPYMFRPVTKQDLEPGPDKNDPSVLYTEQEVEGKVIPSTPDPKDFHVK